MENGNIVKSVKVTHWNSGSRHWKNKIPEIQNVLFSRKPDICLISEANIFSNNEDHKLAITGYSIKKQRQRKLITVDWRHWSEKVFN